MISTSGREAVNSSRGVTQMTGARTNLLIAALLCACTGCASSPWPLGRELNRAQAGLVGDWAVKSGAASGQTTVWRFEARGRVDLLSRSGTSPAKVQDRERMLFRGTWWVYESKLSDRRPLVCFGYRPGREWPSCHWFSIDTIRVVSDSSRGEVVSRLRLIWEGWAGASTTTTDTLTESRAPR
jgi:hypothetical protein